jgi:hypothetical protein
MTQLESLILNPTAKLVLFRQAGAAVAVRVSAPVRGDALHEETIFRCKDPPLFDILLKLASRTDGVRVELEPAMAERLHQIGLLIPPSDAVAPVRFHCFAEDAPAALLFRPAEAAGGTVPDNRGLVVNETLRLLEDLTPYSSVPLLRECAWARVEHAGVPLPSLLSLRPAILPLLRRLSPGQSPPPDVPPEALAILRAAGVLVDPMAAAQKRLLWAEDCAKAITSYRSQRYAAVRGLIHSLQLAALKRYYRALVESGQLQRGDRQVPLRYAEHNEPMARVLHRALTGLVSELAGEALQPSYAYFAAYLPGAVLRPHRDRSQCEVSISLLLDYAPVPEGASPWPLYIEDSRAPGGSAAIYQCPGDGILYRGGELTHYRHALPEGHLSTSLFLHYVPVGFTGSLE